MRHLDEGMLQAWLDRERSGLGSAERAGIELHLSRCVACARALADLVALSERTEELLSTPEPDEVTVPPWEAVVARAGQRRFSGRRRRIWVGTGWAASIAVAIGAGWLANDLHRAEGVGFAAEELDLPGRESAADALPVPSSGEPGRGTEPGSARVEEVRTGTAEARRTEDAARARAEPAEEEARRARMALEEAPRAPAPAVDLFAEPAPKLVSGRVVDEAGRPLAAAQVLVEGTGRGALTREDGTYAISLEGMPDSTRPADLTVTAQLVGYRKASLAPAAPNADVLSADFRLAPSAVALEQVVIRSHSARPSAPLQPGEIILAPGEDAGAWREVTREDAEALAGFTLLTVPDLGVVRIEIEESVADFPLVRVVQELADGGVLDLVQASGTVRFADTDPGDGRTRATIRRDGVTVAAAAPVPLEALQELLRRLSR